MNIPDRLYKFVAINEYSLRNLKNAQLYFNSPSSFNDPFDCSKSAINYSYSDDDLPCLYNLFISETAPGSTVIANSFDDIPRDFVSLVRRKMPDFTARYQREYMHNVGCTCFSESNNNILTWSHYADGHKGLCLEFDTSIELFNKVFKVNYSDSYPNLDFVTLITMDKKDKISEAMLEPLLTKYTCWEYEKEWRAFHQEPNKLYGYGTTGLKSVYFGTSIDEADLEIVCLILLGQHHNINFFRASKSSQRYKLEFSKFNYRPHIDKT